MWSLLEFFPEDFLITVLDVGAALGGERPSYQSLVDAGRARIIGFEPNAQECEKLNSAYGPPHRFFPHFIGDGLSAIFHETNWVYTGSLYPPNTALLEKFQTLAEVTTPVAQHPVMTRRIDDIAEIGPIDFLKIDVQGGELSVFKGAVQALTGMLLVQTEVEFVEMYRGQPLFADVDIFLRGHGFQFHSFEELNSRAFKPIVVNNNIHAGMRQLLWSDAFYVRNWMYLDALDQIQLKKYAVLAHDVMKSWDLAYLILTKLDLKNGGDLTRQYLSRMSHAFAS